MTIMSTRTLTKPRAAVTETMATLLLATSLGLLGCAEGDAQRLDSGTEGLEESSTDMMDGGTSDAMPSTSDSGPEGTSSVSAGDDSNDGGETSGPTTDDGTDGGGTDDGPGGSTGGEAPALDCGSYCDIYMDACGDYSEYANTQHCVDHCGQWPLGAEEDIAGDSLGCRLYHVTVASGTDPALHCPHSGPSGDGVCWDDTAPDCELYCTRYFNNCTGELNVYEDQADCLAQCEPWYPGTLDDASGHTTGCRAYYAGLAAADPEAHCQNAGPGGGEQCVL